MEELNNKNAALLLRYGRIMLKSNYATNDVKNNLIKMSHFIKSAEYSFFVTETALIVINSIDNEVRMVTVKDNAYNFEKTTLVEKEVALFYNHQISADTLYKKLAAIDHMTVGFPLYIQLLCAGTISGAAYCMFNQTSATALLAFFVTIIAYFVYLLVQKFLQVKMLSALVYSLCVSIISILLYKKALIPDSFSLILSGLMPLLPGSVIVNSIKASINGDYISGLTQGIYAINTLLMLVFPVVFVLTNT